MTTTLKQNPTTKDANPGTRNLTPVAEALADILNDTYRLVVKSHTYHWNVTGPLFFAIHNLTEEQYTDMFAAVDVIAERIRALGKPASVSIADLSKSSSGSLAAVEMVKDLLSDHESLVRRFHALVEIAESEKDPVTADLATERSAFHEKAAWMLRSIAA
ncbi:DNA starvation/stationary phase protection protein [Roseovarius sp. Pro17]|uniref:Dps family protein n=1 Tax=Roseovarius sp. Pro17 TaxID=3108175 RepID=UPI002D773866|nr:DNA starvation/stationary phase protection protein [Roseovarius sp. Pro17]